MTQGLRRIAWFLGIAVTVGNAPAADLAATCARLAADPALAKMRVGYAVLDCDDSPNTLLAGRDADGLYIPASNMKVLTTGVALDVLGPKFQFDTRMLLDTSGGRNRLTLVGSGDPALFHPELRDAEGKFVPWYRGNWSTLQDAVAGWAGSLKQADVRQIDELVIDARIFDSERIPADSAKWRDNEPQGTYAVGLWGVNLAGNAPVVELGSNTASKPWIAKVDPPFNWTVASNTATWASAKSKPTFSMQVDSAGDLLKVSLSGSLSPRSTSFSTHIQNAPACVGGMLANLLTQQGVHIAGWKVASATDAPAAGAVVAPVLSTHISTVLVGANTESINLFAEALLKRVAHARTGTAGSWPVGRTLLPTQIASRLGSELALPAGFAAFDGSGLDDRNRVTPRLIAAWMRSFLHSSGVAHDYFWSFAVPGKTGTLRKRFDDSKLDGLLVFGKTGYIDGASCLSGILANPSTRRSIAYSVLCNDTSKGPELTAARALQEKIVLEIADFLRTAPAKQPAIATGN